MLIGLARGYVRIALIFLLVGGLLGLLARIQLMQPGMAWIGGSELPGLLTLHAVVLVLLCLVPLQLGGFLATLRCAAPPRPAAWLARAGLGLLALSALVLHAGIAVQLARKGLAGLPAPRWLGGIGGRIPPLAPSDAVFVASLAGIGLAHALSGLGVVAAGAAALRTGQRLHGAAGALVGLATAVCFGGVVVGIAAHAAGASLGLGRPLWWWLFDAFEAPAAWLLVLPLLWLVAYLLAGPSDPRTRAGLRSFGGTAVVLAGAAAAVGAGPGPGYGAVLALHLLLAGGLLFGGFALLYALWPALAGRVPRQGMAWAHWAATLAGFALLILGMLGLAAASAPRRVASVPALAGHELWHLLASLGAFALGGAVAGGLALSLWSAPRESWSEERVSWDPTRRPQGEAADAADR